MSCRRTHGPWVTAALAASAVTLSAPLALADDTEGGGWFTVGYLFSTGDSRSPAAGHGGEGTYVWYPDAREAAYGIGGFVQAQSYGSHGRYAVGGQANYRFVGMELGYSLREAHGKYTKTHGLQLTPFASIGAIALGLRTTWPVADNDNNSGFEYAFTLALKLGGPVGGKTPDFVKLNIPAGRPLRVDGVLQTAASCARADWRARLRPRLAQLSRQRRHWLTAQWLADALDEHSSIAAFERLERELRAFGADDDLRGQVRRAARQERKHARLCFGLASAYGGTDLGPSKDSLPSRGPVRSLEQLVFECVVDGCIGEGAAARVANRVARSCRDPVVQRVLNTIAVEEADHAKLAWDVLDFLHTLAPRRVDALAVAAALDSPLEAQATRAKTRGLHLGRPTRHVMQHAYRASRQATLTRLHRSAARRLTQTLAAHAA